MAFLDLTFRFGSIGLLTVLTVLVWRDLHHQQAKFILVGLCVTTIAMLLSHVPDYVTVPYPLWAAARIMDVPNLIFIWLFGFQMFDDQFKIKPIHIVGALLYILPVCVTRAYDLGLVPSVSHSFVVVIDIYAISLILYLLYVILKGRSDDLISERRRIRIYFVLVLIAVTLFATTADMLSPGYHLTVANWAKVLMTFPLTAWAYLWLTRFQEEKLLFKPHTAVITKAPKPDPRDSLLQSELMDLMEQHEAYTEPGLTIRTLAGKLKAPEHRLRRLINQGLGYRNFSAFLNSYRIEAVKRAFSDPKNARIPVLTIAMDVGFNSLAPFNRAFRDAEGVTPSMFRRNLQINADGNQKTLIDIEN